MTKKIKRMLAIALFPLHVSLGMTPISSHDFENHLKLRYEKRVEYDGLDLEELGFLDHSLVATNPKPLIQENHLGIGSLHDPDRVNFHWRKTNGKEEDVAIGLEPNFCRTCGKMLTNDLLCPSCLEIDSQVGIYLSTPRYAEIREHAKNTTSFISKTSKTTPPLIIESEPKKENRTSIFLNDKTKVTDFSTINLPEWSPGFDRIIPREYSLDSMTPTLNATESYPTFDNNNHMWMNGLIDYKRILEDENSICNHDSVTMNLAGNYGKVFAVRNDALCPFCGK